MILKFRPDAVQDLDNAVLWYENNQKGLGERFLLAVDASIESITRNYNTYPQIYKNFRRKIIKKFPYSIVYCIEGNTIVVLAVFHSKRNPIKLTSRIS